MAEAKRIKALAEDVADARAVIVLVPTSLLPAGASRVLTRVALERYIRI